MAKDTTKINLRARTEELRREIESASSWQAPLRSRNFFWWMLIWGAFVFLVGFVVIWTRQQPLLDADRLATKTRTTRVAFEIEDKAATEQARANASAQAPRVYQQVPGVLDELRKSIEGLPLVCKDAQTPEEIEPSIRTQFAIDELVLLAAKRQIDGNELRPSWKASVGRVVDRLALMPLVARDTYQLESQSLSKRVELRPENGEGPTRFAPATNVLNVEASDLAQQLRSAVNDPNITPVLQDAILARLVQQPRPTYTYDAAATSEKQLAAAKGVPPQIIKYPAREPIYRRGEPLTETQIAVTREAIQAEQRSLSPIKLWAQRGALLGLVGAIALAMAGYTVLFVPRIRRNPARMGAIAGLLAAMAMLACYTTAAQPGLIALTAVAPTVFCAVLVCIAYSQRVALAYGSLHALLVCAALDQPVGVFAIMITGIGAAVWKLKDIRDRDTLITAGLFVAIALAVGTFLMNIVELPLSMQAIRQAAWDAGLAGFGGMLVAGVTLFILPTLEKSFSITTGLTLIELRDPKQPLLRQLQQRAPGTYNHSLTLAALGEAAAEAIGANGLLTYVGALYHDIGKMNKPDYFVENQAPGFNRHDKLSPAMSLLIIVGHVKDGLELAREFNLPRPLWHFIESHHGTTLVEYFFHRAKRQAEAGSGGQDAPEEIEYRYPGPRPQTKEAAIIMICDAVESAARAMADPTPSRIDTLVRAIATKRLMDGQFDECDLTLRELNTITESVSKTLASIYHGRIAYPGGGSGGGSSSSTQDESRTRTGLTTIGPGSGPSQPVITPGKNGGNGVAALKVPLGGGPETR